VCKMILSRSSVVQVTATSSAAGCVLRSGATAFVHAGFLEAWREASRIRSRYPAKDSNSGKGESEGDAAEASGAFRDGTLDRAGAEDLASSTADDVHYSILAKLKVGDNMSLEAGEIHSHETAAPGAFREASLVKALEELGIGRPATYATTISNLINRCVQLRLCVSEWRPVLC
jgi:hypothetical protein